MDDISDTYKTLSKPSTEVLFKEKKSKFYGYAFPIHSEEDVKPIINNLKKKHHTANHVCYAWQLGITKIRYRANDDGEPNNSAGAPIYGQIQAFEVTNTLVAVARIFGGTKLGVGGLISSYRTAAQMALEASTIIDKVQKASFQLTFDYPEMNKVMRVIKQRNLEVTSQEMQAKCSMVICTRLSEADALENILKTMHTITSKKLA